MSCQRKSLSPFLFANSIYLHKCIPQAVQWCRFPMGVNKITETSGKSGGTGFHRLDSCATKVNFAEVSWQTRLNSCHFHPVKGSVMLRLANGHCVYVHVETTEYSIQLQCFPYHYLRRALRIKHINSAYLWVRCSYWKTEAIPCFYSIIWLTL